MVEKVITKKTFTGRGGMGHLAYPGDIVDVDAKGEVMPAASTPIGSLTVDQLRSLLAAKESEKPEDKFGDNVADPVETNTGSQELAMAPVAPASPGSVQPQGIPPGSVPVGGGFLRRAPEDAPAAVEEIISPEQSTEEEDKPRRGRPPRGK